MALYRVKGLRSFWQNYPISSVRSSDLLSTAAQRAALGPCFGTVKRVIHLEDEKKKPGSRSEREEEAARSGSG